MTSPELDKAEAVLPPMAEDLIDLVKTVAEPLNAEIARLSSELAASRERERALERERDEWRASATEFKGLCEEWQAMAERAEAEVKRLRAETIEECAQAIECDCCDVCGESPEYENVCANELAARIRALSEQEAG